MHQKNILVSLVIIFLVATAVWTIQLLQGKEPFVDRMTRDFVFWLEDSILSEPFQYITHLGSGFFLYPFVFAVMILLFIWYRDWIPCVFFGGGIYLAHLINQGIKLLITRERPSISMSLNAEGYSFPSGHAMISMVCYGLFAYFLVKKLKKRWLKFMVYMVFTILILLIGLSRYVINVHYLTDVLAGFFIGYLLLISYIFLYERLKNRHI